MPGRIPKPIKPTYAATVMNGPSGGKFRDPSLIDFGTDPAGNHRRLELLGGVLVDRPLAQDALPGRRLPAAWQEAGAI